jgi:hypothetical protein
VRCTFFIAAEAQSPGTPLRIAVPTIPPLEAPLLSACEASAPGCTATTVDLGVEGPDAELALLDYWSDLSAAQRHRVWGAAGPVAGALARFDDQPSFCVALLGSAIPQSAAPNAQSRALLMAAHPDSWTLALDRRPDVDADAWRWRLSTVLRERWRIAGVERPSGVPAALDVLLRGDPLSWPEDVATGRVGSPPLAADGWLDAELFERLPAGPAALSSWGQPGPAAVEPKARADAESKVIRGKRSRLFLAHDSHDSHRQIIGERPLSADELDVWERGTAARMADLGSLGCRLLYVIGPAPQVVHAEDLPDAVSVSNGRPARQVLDRLGAMRPAPEVIYPLEELRQARALCDPFGKTDSHWNDLGAYLAYEAVCKRVRGQVPGRWLDRAALAFQDTCYVGDLGAKLRPQRAGTFLRARLDRPCARLVVDNRVRNHGRIAVFECAAAPPNSCLVFGDSWAYPMLLYLSESFRRLVFYHRVNVVDRQPILDERPDVVLMVLTERFCTALPDDAGAIPFDRVVAKKLRADDLVPATSPNQRHQFLHSVVIDRGLPEIPGFRLPPEPGSII